MSRQQAGGGQEGGMDHLWALGAIIVAAVLIWYFFGKHIAHFLFIIRLHEIQGLQFVIGGWNAFASVLHIPTFAANDLRSWQVAIERGTVGNDIHNLLNITDDVGSYLRFPIAILLAGFAIIVYSKNVVLKFKTTFNMKNMRQIEKDNWPQIIPIVHLNLVKQDINKGPWAMALSPMQYCKANNLLKEKVGLDGKPAVDVIRPDAHQIFVMQLGALMQDPKNLPIHVKALFGIFAACANQERESGMNLAKQIDRSAANDGKLDFTGAEELFAKHYNSKLVVKVLQKHAYVLTVMASMIELARTDGVFASSEFLWLKPVDRRLWYMLNTVGRQTAVVEIAGAFAHWVAERKWGGALRTPMVDEAIKGLDIAISEVIYEPTEE